MNKIFTGKIKYIILIIGIISLLIILGISSNIKKNENAAQQLISQAGENGLEKIKHKTDSTLQIGNNENVIEYRFRGSNTTVTNNYVYFNCKNVENQTKDTCELYRIIGIFPTDDGTGKIENRIKLVKENSYGKYEWNKNKTNNWAELTTMKLPAASYGVSFCAMPRRFKCNCLYSASCLP